MKAGFQLGFFLSQGQRAPLPKGRGLLRHRAGGSFAEGQVAPSPKGRRLLRSFGASNNFSSRPPQEGRVMLLMPPRPAPRNSFDDSGDFSRDNFGFNSSGCASVFIGRLGQAYGLQCILFMASPGRRGGHHPLSSLPPVSRSLVFNLPYASVSRHRWGYSFLSVQSATCRTLCDRPPQVLVLSEVPDSCLSVGGGRLPPRFKFVQLLFRGVSEDSDVGS